MNATHDLHPLRDIERWLCVRTWTDPPNPTIVWTAAVGAVLPGTRAYARFSATGLTEDDALRNLNRALLGVATHATIGTIAPPTEGP